MFESAIQLNTGARRRGEGYWGGWVRLRVHSKKKAHPRTRVKPQSR